MAAINPTGGIRPPMVPSGLSGSSGSSGLGGSSELGGAARQEPPAGKADFGKMLGDYLGEVNNKQQASYEAIKDLIAGKTQDILPVVNAVAQADMGFKLLMGVRNKVIEAYKQTMNMQI